ncbi:hypothetical protein Tco_0989420 [Tanacetum coccineum]|uniref:Reverse transcriptase domain-containing protein n=1 Tax=Tanacetum coccineum TaxID=301880 RepID=A0ABQ5ETK8_9ASTR
MSNLKKCLSDESLVIPLEELHVDDKLHFMEEPVEVMDREIKQLKRSHIPIIKVRWNSKRVLEFTSECEDQFKQKNNTIGFQVWDIVVLNVSPWERGLLLFWKTAGKLNPRSQLKVVVHEIKPLKEMSSHQLVLAGGGDAGMVVLALAVATTTAVSVAVVVRVAAGAMAAMVAARSGWKVAVLAGAVAVTVVGSGGIDVMSAAVAPLPEQPAMPPLLVVVGGGVLVVVVPAGGGSITVLMVVVPVCGMVVMVAMVAMACAKVGVGRLGVGLGWWRGGALAEWWRGSSRSGKGNSGGGRGRGGGGHGWRSGGGRGGGRGGGGGHIGRGGLVWGPQGGGDRGVVGTVVAVEAVVGATSGGEGTMSWWRGNGGRSGEGGDRGVVGAGVVAVAVGCGGDGDGDGGGGGDAGGGKGGGGGGGGGCGVVVDGDRGGGGVVAVVMAVVAWRSEGEELEYPFFEGDGSSSNEWRDYGMASNDYEGPPVFDDDQYEEESMPLYDTDIEDVIEEEE